MNNYRYKLTLTGWIGAALFILPTPIAAWEWSAALQRFSTRGEYQRTLEKVGGVIAMPEFSAMFFTALATASLAGLVMVIVGRELEAV